MTEDTNEQKMLVWKLELKVHPVWVRESFHPTAEELAEELEECICAALLPDAQDHELTVTVLEQPDAAEIKLLQEAPDNKDYER